MNDKLHIWLWMLALSVAQHPLAQSAPYLDHDPPPHVFGYGSLNTVACSPDGRLCATGGSGGAFVWDLDSGVMLQRVTQLVRPAECVVFSPDGKHLLVGNATHSAQIVNVESGRIVRDLGRPASRAVFSPDGAKVLTLAHKHSPELTDLGSGDSCAVFPQEVTPGTLAVFSNDGRQLAYAQPYEGHVLHVIDGPAMDRIRHVEGVRRELAGLAFREDEEDFLICLADGSVLQLGKGAIEATPIAKIRIPDRGLLTLSPDGSRIVVHEPGGRFGAWETGTAKSLARWVSPAPGSYLGSLPHWFRNRAAWVPGSSQVLTTGGDHTLRLWDSATGKVIRTFVGHTELVRPVVVSGNETRVLTVDQQYDYTPQLLLWDLTSGRLLRALGKTRVPSAERTPNVTCAALDHEAGYAALGCHNGQVQLWDLQTGSMVRVLEPPRAMPVMAPQARGRYLRAVLSLPRSVSALLFLPSGDRILVGFNDARVLLYERDTGAVVSEFQPSAFPKGPRGRVSPHQVSFTLSPDARSVAIAMGTLERAWVNIRDLETREALCWIEPQGLSGAELAVAFNNTGSRLVVAGYSPQLTLTHWNAETGSPLSSCKAPIFSSAGMSLAADGTYLLIPTAAGLLQLDAESGKVIQSQELKQHVDVAIPLQQSEEVLLVSHSQGAVLSEQR